MTALAVHRFFADDRVAAILLVLALDFGLGVISSVVKGSFRLSFIADVLRNDVLGKVLPFFVLYSGYVYAAHVDIVIPGLDLAVIMNGAFIIVVGALAGSVLNSLRDLGLFSGLADGIAGADTATNDPPPKP